VDSSRAEVVVRDARDTDRPALVGFMVALQDFERALQPDRARGAEMADAHLAYLQRLAAEDGLVLVADAAGQPVGFLVLVIEQCDPGDLHLSEGERRHGWVTDLFVTAEWRSQGIARRLLARAGQHCVDLGLATLQIASLADNPAALRAYEGAGFDAYEITLVKRLRPIGG